MSDWNLTQRKLSRDQNRENLQGTDFAGFGEMMAGIWGNPALAKKHWKEEP